MAARELVEVGLELEAGSGASPRLAPILMLGGLVALLATLALLPTALRRRSITRDPVSPASPASRAATRALPGDPLVDAIRVRRESPVASTARSAAHRRPRRLLQPGVLARQPGPLRQRRLDRHPPGAPTPPSGCPDRTDQAVAPAHPPVPPEPASTPMISGVARPGR